jgi:hypothetical protein
MQQFSIKYKQYVLFVLYEQQVKLMLNYKAHNTAQSDGRTPADQINARLAVRAKTWL